MTNSLRSVSHGPVKVDLPNLKMVIFHSYVSLPEGTSLKIQYHIDIIISSLLDPILPPFWLNPITSHISLTSGKRLHNYEISQCLMGKSTISMAIFNSKLLNYQRVTFSNHVISPSTRSKAPTSARIEVQRGGPETMPGAVRYLGKVWGMYIYSIRLDSDLW